MKKKKLVTEGIFANTVNSIAKALGKRMGKKILKDPEVQAQLKIVKRDLDKLD